MKNNVITCSVLMITYNHEKYFAKAIESVLMQKTNFDYEIVIGEDCSTDSTREIVLDYKAKHDDKIKLLLQEKNIGMMLNFIDTLKTCTGKYIALLEGDDYWTDPYKLQKQVDFLEANPNYGMVYSDIDTVDNGNNVVESEFFIKQKIKYRSGNIFNHLFKTNFINTLTVCIRTQIIKRIFSKYYKPNMWFIIDYWIWLHIALETKVYFMKIVTAGYRLHNDGISKKKKFLKNRISFIKYDVLNRIIKEKVFSSFDKNERLVFIKNILLLLYSKNILLKHKFYIIVIIVPNVITTAFLNTQK